MSKTDSEDRIGEDTTRPVAERTLGLILTIGGVIGLIASWALAVEKIAMLRDPDYTPSCSINPVLSCGSVMETAQAELFGFPNPFIGLMSFPVVITVGVLVLSRVRLPRWIWWGMQLGTLLGAVFITWLFIQSLYSIGALCPYCMVVWAMVMPIFWYTTVYNISRRNFSKTDGEVGDWLYLHWAGLVLWVFVLLILIMIRFWSYWQTLL
ncbi:vitamin K epoxide reductase family protein [Stackebrandtia nassauensis]|uniref:Vitamin K epoxide reductase n=1 Tax=Stackebrandtia nassauensis (strain DSM 44728 / CIP 108903 / NRRL B-16338 / NBRC 102104 / LLR-40K-21) TaxID=446470 RepID=D3Q7L0_STANL|nr:vitamin K epoxide reductase family protein [Stackebrandtia nassauensis]ADD44352.1 Vitamin K epoxide reductase [Stackebrandtia nassauensis DSM 44728]